MLVEKIIVSKNGIRQACAAISEQRPLDTNLSNWQVVTLVLSTLGIDYEDPYG